MQYKAAITLFLIILTAVLIDFAYKDRSRDAYIKGQASLQAGDTDSAIAHFSKALRKNPADPASRLGLGQAYHKKGWLDAALKQYEQAIELNSRDQAARERLN